MPDSFRKSEPEFDANGNPVVPTRDIIDEALARHAQRRKDLGPPKELPKTPTLPKQPRPAQERKREAEKKRFQQLTRRGNPKNPPT